MWIKKFLPREEKFFTYFEEITKNLVDAAKLLIELVQNPQNHNLINQIKDLEHKGDEITHKTVSLLHKTFITPIERDDIHKLITSIDDVLDYIDAVSQRFKLYNITNTNVIYQNFAKIIQESSVKILEVIKELDNMKKQNEILTKCIEINRLENEADQLLRESIAKLFQTETNPIELIKLKEIYEILESITDRCEDVANIIEGIVLENA
jgi:hypothetical protein